MTNQPFSTLAYTKSPKTTRRTTFQDELQAAVSARANQTKTDRYSYSDDFNDDEDDFFNELLKSRKKKSGSIKTAKSQAKINNFDISDDEGKQGRTKKVSFLKTQRIVSPSPSKSREDEPPDPPASPHSSPGLVPPSSPRSTNISDENVRLDSNDALSTDSRITRRSSSKSVSYHTSDDSLLDMPLPLPSDNIIEGPPCLGEERSSALEGGSQTAPVSAPDLPRVSSPDTNREPPRPKPRQRTLGLGLRAVEKAAEDAGSPDVSRPQTSSASIPLSPDTSSSLACGEGSRAASGCLSKSSLRKSEQSQLKTTVDSGSRDGFISDGSEALERNYSTSFEEFHADSGDHLQVPAVHQKACETRSHSVCSGEVESKYLGTLKLLDRKVSPHESEPRAVDSLRAAIYQEWLQKKKEKSRDTMQIKKEEEILKEKKLKEEEAKKGDAVASYEAWKEKKAESLKAKAKEKQDAIRKAQRAKQENEEKKQSAKQVFEKWKLEHDRILIEKSRRQREVENKLSLRKQQKEEERKRGSKSAFSDWREKKTVVLHEKVSIKREESQNKAEEERYMKEERDKMALEMYESWLVRKDLEQKRQREERRIQAILQDDPPPPWSPPNKTIPFGK
ncbi:microtubule-associated protein 9 [Pungitius pungitius]|uniref:microtubule-associated protein 9 n=1 Tax=Pungitius pungitius TaxID=134920 RepID=UPI002E136AA6